MIRTVLFLFALLIPSLALAGTSDITPGGAGSVRATIGGTGALTFVTSSAASEETANGVIGNISVTDTNARSNNVLIYSTYTTISSGNVSHCFARLDPVANGDDFAFVIYDLAGNKLSEGTNTNPGSTLGWKPFVMTSSASIALGTSYVLGVVGAVTNFSVSKDASETGHVRRSIPMNYSTNLPATADFSSSNYTEFGVNSAHNFRCNNTGVSP